MFAQVLPARAHLYQFGERSRGTGNLLVLLHQSAVVLRGEKTRVSRHTVARSELAEKSNKNKKIKNGRLFYTARGCQTNGRGLGVGVSCTSFSFFCFSTRQSNERVSVLDLGFRDLRAARRPGVPVHARRETRGNQRPQAADNVFLWTRRGMHVSAVLNFIIFYAFITISV